MPKKSQTNETTGLILRSLFEAKVFAWRQNVLPVPMVRQGVLTGFRPGSKTGITDICGIIPGHIGRERKSAGLHSKPRDSYGIPLFIEVKTGRDRLRPEQIGFIRNAESAGAIVLVVKDHDDFLAQWKQVIINLKANV